MGFANAPGQRPQTVGIEIPARYQTENLYWLNSQKRYYAPHGWRRQVTYWNYEHSQNCIDHKNVAVVKRHVYRAEHQQKAHSPRKSACKRATFLLLVVVHDKET